MLKIFQSSDTKIIDEFTIAHEPISSINLMERAAGELSARILSSDLKLKKIKIFVGPGNNGGDGLAMARILSENNLDVCVYRLTVFSSYSADNQTNLARINPAILFSIHSKSDFPKIDRDDLVIDAIFGSGLNKALDGLTLDLVNYLNAQHAITIAIDMPSGLFSEISMPEKASCIKATYTLCLENYKLACFMPENEMYIGKCELVPIGLHPKIMEELKPLAYMITKNDVQLMLKDRSKFSHKGIYGHALLIAGSKEKMGAALLSSKAALRTGVGLLTAHIPQSGSTALNTYIPEAMASLDAMDYLSSLPNSSGISAIGIGPGIGNEKQTENTVKLLIQECRLPIVFDADALNILAENKTWLSFLPANSILTPHPKEFERLFGKTENGFERLQLQQRMSQKFNVLIVLKGAFTSISLPNGMMFFNSTGNPGMATAGTGDVLTGIILSLLAQGFIASQAAQLGVFLHGLAGDFAAEKWGYEAMLASDLINEIGTAFHELRSLDLV